MNPVKKEVLREQIEELLRQDVIEECESLYAAPVVLVPKPNGKRHQHPSCQQVAAVAEWYRYRTVACFVTGSSPVPLKTRRVGQRCTLNLSRAETSSRWCGVVVRRGGASSGVVHVT
ncbi:uncharacterized protein TNCV_2021681 [Trichonephila clavipes]|nr:uncharacterized protein TNCV_2021681 [Trichonephila clavipes]